MLALTSPPSHEGHPSGLTLFTLTRFCLELMLNDRTLLGLS